MNPTIRFAKLFVILALISQTLFAVQQDDRMQWWREARFGLFIHWGLYAVPAGEWNGKTDYGEWIRSQAEIPLEEYDKLVPQFNPVQFNAEEWVRMAKAAGMKYIVITSKHHDGFCLFDLKVTDYDVMSTPFKRDIIKELSDACKKEGIAFCVYYSIMDWHHPDYLPRRGWEKQEEPSKEKFDQYVAYMKRQLKELIENYGPLGVLWFDGEWEQTEYGWSAERGIDLYNYVRSLQPSIIVNNRVGVGRSGMQGFTREGEFGGDFGTPEQEVPAMGLPGVDWESCMTMNRHWGYNKHDDDWKSGPELIRTLTDIASKGGNYLLNIGPTAEGTFPPESIERLRSIGQWMEKNSESIYGTSASPFPLLPWGRCTQKTVNGTTLLYLHVFDWPGDGKLLLSGLLDDPVKAYFLTDASRSVLSFERQGVNLSLHIVAQQRDPVNTVIVLEFPRAPEVAIAPRIVSSDTVFIDYADVEFKTDSRTTEIRYTLDGSDPSAQSPIANAKLRLTNSATVSAALFRNGTPVSPVARLAVRKVATLPAKNPTQLVSGVRYTYYEGDWDWLPDFSALSAVKKGTQKNFDLAPRNSGDNFGFVFDGYLRVLEDAVYTFYTQSDDGSQLFIGDSLVVDNDGLHSIQERAGVIALAAGVHPIRVTFFEKTGGEAIKALYSSRSIQLQAIPDSILFHRSK
ncbi:MAG: alpha-L-fucosidase [Ignavibacteriae bacterium]|nr:alpha-L-fucosidase [Ignavibacteriota bacterium]